MTYFKSTSTMFYFVLFFAINTLAGPMVLTYNTNLSEGTEIQLPLYGTVDVIVDWGDGSKKDTVKSEGNITHVYATEGEYSVNVSGKLSHFGSAANHAVGIEKLLSVKSFGDLGLTSLGYAFRNALNLVEVPTLLPSTIEDIKFLFSGAQSFNQDISSWDVSNVKDMIYLFSGAKSFNQDISNWDVSQLTSMTNMFSGAESFDQNLNDWNVSQVNDMSYMFSEAASFNQNLTNWDVSSVKNMSYMFADATTFNQDINSWNVSQVNDMSYMFMKATSFNQELNKWDVSSVRNMSGMFANVTSFNRNLKDWDVSSVKNMNYMFLEATTFDQELNNWDVSSVSQMSYMFSGADSFNQDVSSWDVSNVTGMSYMFSNATSFNQNISSWNIYSVRDMSEMFAGTTMSLEHYNAILQNWSMQEVQVSVKFSAGNSKYSLVAKSARDKLSLDKHWVIEDGGELKSPQLFISISDTIVSEDFSEIANYRDLNKIFYNEGEPWILSYTVTSLKNIVTPIIIDDSILKITSNGNSNGEDIIYVTANNGHFKTTESFILKVTPVNDKPTSDNGIISINKNASYEFSENDFYFADVDNGDVLTNVKIIQATSKGVFELAGKKVTNSQIIPVKDLGKLSYQPAKDKVGLAYDNLEFKVGDGSAYSEKSYKITFDVGQSSSIDYTTELLANILWDGQIIRLQNYTGLVQIVDVLGKVWLEDMSTTGELELRLNAPSGNYWIKLDSEVIPIVK